MTVEKSSTKLIATCEVHMGSSENRAHSNLMVYQIIITFPIEIGTGGGYMPFSDIYYKVNPQF